MSSEPHLALVLRAIRPFRRRALFVMFVVLADTVLASLGIAMVLPLLQAFLDPEKVRKIAAFAPILGAMSHRELMLWIASATAIVFVLKAAVSIASVALSRGLSERLRTYWISKIGERYLLGRYGKLQSHKQGALLNTWFNESGVAARFFIGYAAYVTSSVMAGALVILGFVINWIAMLAFVCVGAIAIFLLRNRLFGAMTRLGGKKLKLHQGMNSTMAESLLHARELKILGAEPSRIEQIDQSAAGLRSVLVRTGVLSEVPRLAGESLAVIVLVGSLVVGIVFMNSEPNALLPLLAFFFVAFYRLMTSTMTAVGARMKALSDLQSLRAVQTLLDEKADLEDRVSGERIDRLATAIRFENVAFGYDAARPVVQDLSFEIPIDGLVLLIGPSGAGKSTLLDLLLRLHRPTSGAILANGRDIADFNLLDWRRRFGYVSQEAALFAGTIRQNLHMAAPGATDAELVEACRLAGAHSFIEQFPNGYDTVVGDRGHSVSGGQRKRIAIARALLREPSVLILDEATTSFEQSLEREMLRELRKARPTLGVIQVTHRLQSAGDADWVLALEGGRVVAHGAWLDVHPKLASWSVAPASTAP